MKHKGEISFGRGQNAIHIEVHDEASRTICVEIEIPMDAFGRVVTGGSGTCSFTVRAGKIGWQREHKSEKVPFDHYAFNAKTVARAAKKALTPFEVDGWIGNIGDLTNQHCRLESKPITYTVRFERWLQPTK